VDALVQTCHTRRSHDACIRRGHARYAPLIRLAALACSPARSRRRRGEIAERSAGFSLLCNNNGPWPRGEPRARSGCGGSSTQREPSTGPVDRGTQRAANKSMQKHADTEHEARQTRVVQQTSVRALHSALAVATYRMRALCHPALLRHSASAACDRPPNARAPRVVSVCGRSKLTPRSCS
jgi:hypothetical protein